jgi:WD40 repeat protein
MKPVLTLALLCLTGLPVPMASQEAMPEIVPQVGGAIGMLKVTFSSDGKWLASSDQNGQVRIYDVIGGRLAREMNTAGGATAIHPSKPTLASVGRSGQLTLYDLAGGKPVWSVAAGTCAVLQFTDDGRKLCGGCSEPGSGLRKLPSAYIKSWDAESGHELSSRGYLLFGCLQPGRPVVRWYAQRVLPVRSFAQGTPQV